jgi:acetyl-CoA synthetase
MADLESILHETRVFKPDAAFSKQANWSKAEAKAMRELGEKNPQRFWAKMAKENLTWIKPWKKVLDWKAPNAKWFVGGKLNVSDNCLDRHIEGEGSFRKNKAAIIWEGEPGDTRTITYNQLHREVCKFSNVLKGQGVKKGDRVILYMPMIPELAMAMLACTRIGAIHSIIFGGFSAASISDRANDAGAKIIVTADGGFRRGKPFGLKSIVDDALKKSPGVSRVIVAKRTAQKTGMKKGRDLWWDDLMADASAVCPPAVLDSEDPMFILYTSGTTGKPKGILHTTGGYLTQAATTSKYVFDLKDDDIYWCTADIGWVTGHSYGIYGILANGRPR